VSYHSLSPLYPIFQDTYQHRFVNLIENFSDLLQEIWPERIIRVRHFFFDILKEEEINWSNARVVGLMWQSFGFGCPDTLLRYPLESKKGPFFAFGECHTPFGRS
jgi:hypothetical protein